jgi:uncharacterized protein
MKTKSQIFIIHGGTTFKSKKDFLNYLKIKKVSLEKKTSWALEYLDKNLGKYFQIVRPKMPLKEDAKYEEWKIFFERHFPLLKNNITLIGVSLGGIFLAKYLSENKFPKKIKAVFLICPPFDNTTEGEDLVGGFRLQKDLNKLDNSSKNVYLMFSKDDPIVPISHADKYRQRLKKANIIIYENKNGHFMVEKFPELIKIIKKLK